MLLLYIVNNDTEISPGLPSDNIINAVATSES